MIALDDYQIADEPFLGGANFYYSEVGTLLAPEEAVALHSLPSITRSRDAARKALGALGPDDTVLAGTYNNGIFRGRLD